MFAISWLAYVLLVIGFGAIAFAILAPGRGPDPDPPAVMSLEDPGSSFEAAAAAPHESEPNAPRRITWPSLIDGSHDEVEPESRIRMIEGLGQLAESWCGPILAAAYLEEDEGRVREAILRAVRDAGYRECDDVIEAALRSERVVERLLAVELADTFDARAALDRALVDEENVVATAAVYALKKRMSGSLLAYVEQYIPRERAARLLNAIRVLT